MSDFATHSGRIDSRLIADLVIQHIEQILPEIIEELNIPDPMSRAERWRLEAGVFGRPGFRPFRGAKKEEVIAVLKTDDVRRQLCSFVRASAHASFGGRGNYTVPKTLVLGGSTWIGRSPSWEHSDTKAIPVDLPLTSYSYSWIGAEGSESSDVPAKLPLMPMQSVKNFGFEGGIGTETRETAVPHTLLKQDVRGRRALVKEGKLLGLPTDLPQDLVPKDMELIKFPNSETYRSLNLTTLLERYRALALDLPVNKPVTNEVGQELRLIECLVEALDVEERWAQINNRRFYLITKKHSRGLNSHEQSELDALQDLAWRRSETLAPLPFLELARLEEYAHQARLTAPD